MYDRENRLRDNESFAYGVWILLFCLIMGLCGAVSTAANRREAARPEPPIPAGVPPDVPPMDGDVWADSDAYLVVPGSELEVTVYFEPHNAVKGLWNGTNASLEILDPYTESPAADTNHRTWSDTLVSNAPNDKSFNPWVSANLAFGEEYLHSWISASASVDIQYPASSGSGFVFTNVSQSLSRQIRFFPITAEEMHAVQAHASWATAREEADPESYKGVTICLGVVAAFGMLLTLSGLVDRGD